MSIFRRLSLYLLGFLLRTLLFIGFSTLALAVLYGNSAHIKEALSSSNAYNRGIDAAIASAKQQPQTDGSIPFDDPEIQRIIRESFSPQQLQGYSESAIDSTYTWLDGKTQTLSFKIDLSKNKEKFANDLSGYAVSRIVDLPSCRSVPKETNVFKISCLPPFLDLSAQRITLRDSILDSKQFLPDSVLTQADLPKNDKGQTAAESLVKAPEYFAWFKKAPFILLSISAIIGTIIIYMQRTKRTGFRQISWVLVSTGIGLIIAPLIYNLFGANVTRTVQKSLGGSNGFEGIVNDVANRLYAETNNALLNIGVQVLAVGVILLIILRFTRPRSAYNEVEYKAGLENGIGDQKNPRDAKLSEGNVPVQTSEAPYKRRLPSKVKRKYRKIQL